MQRSRGTNKYLNFGIVTSHNADIQEYTMAVLKYWTAQNIHIAGDINWGHVLWENDH